MKLLKINLIFSLLLLLVLTFITVSPVKADTVSIAGLQVNFSATLSQAQVIGTQPFSLSVNATAHCLSDLSFPLTSVSEVRITSRVVAINIATGAQVPAPLTANDYAISISNFPKKVGQADLAVSQVVQLQFPSGIQSGNYSIVGQLITAQGILPGLPPISVMSLLSDSQKVLSIGSIAYFTTAVTPTSTPTPTPTPVITGGSSGGGGGGGGGGSNPITPTPTPSPEASPAQTQTPVATPLLTPSNSPTPSPASTSSGGDLSQSISSSGTAIAKIKADSTDKKASVTIEAGITGRDASGAPLKQVSVTLVTKAPDPPPAARQIGPSYDFGPTGTVFDRPVTLTLQYDTASVNGVDPSGLYLGWWNTATGKWENLPSQVDPVTHSVSAQVAHFTLFSILAPVTPATNPPAATTATATPIYSTPPQTPSTSVATVPAPALPTPQPASSTRLLSGGVIALMVLFVLGASGVILTMWRIAVPSKRK